MKWVDSSQIIVYKGRFIGKQLLGKFTGPKEQEAGGSFQWEGDRGQGGKRQMSRLYGSSSGGWEAQTLGWKVQGRGQNMPCNG